MLSSRKVSLWLGGYNRFHILRLFDVLPNFLSPQVKQSVIITYKHGIYELPHDLSNDLRLRKLQECDTSATRTTQVRHE